MLPSLKDKIHAPFAEGGILSGVMAVIAVIYPVCALFSKQANDVLFWLLVVLSIGVIFCRKGKGYSFSRFLKDYWPLWLAMSLLFFAELSNQLFATRLRLSLLFSEPFRLVLLPLLVYGWLALPLEKLKQARWGWMLCAVAGGLFLFFISDMGKYRPNTHECIGVLEAISVIPFTNLVVLMGFMAIFAIGWDKPKKILGLVLGILVLFLVIEGAYVSQTRLSWIIVLIMSAVTGRFFWKENRSAIVVIGCVVLFFTALSCFLMPKFHLLERVKQAQNDIVLYQKGDANTSIGARLQLWEGALMIFTEHPWTGIGGRSAQFQDAIAQTDLTLSHETKKQRQAHNEFLQRAVRYGILGIIAILAVLGTPFFYFIRYLRSSDSVLRTVAFIGMVYNLGICVWGLPDVIFEWRVTVQFYVVVFSVLFAILIKQKNNSYYSI